MWIWRAAMMPMFHTAQLNAFCTPAVMVGATIYVLRGLLDGYKVPKAVIVLDELPKTSTGKIQKNVLRDRHAAYYEG